MGIVIRNKKSFWKWSQTTGQRLCPNEQYLGNLLYRRPEIIPMQNISKSKIQVMLWGVTIDNLEIDLIGLSNTGEISIIETKLSTNKEIDPSKPNNIFQQVNKYNSFLMNKDYNFLNEIAQNTEGRSLLELLKDKEKTLSNKDLAKFKKNIEKNLRLGNFVSLLATDNIGQHENFIYEILKRRKNGQNIYALELSCFANEKEEIIFPRFFPAALPKKHAKLPPIVERENVFFKKVKEYCQKKDANKILNLYDWIKKKKKFKINWYYCPTFLDALSFSPYIKRKNKNVYLFYLDCYGIMRICNENKNFQDFQDILGEEIEIVYDNWHYFSLNRLSKGQKMKEFKKLMS